MSDLSIHQLVFVTYEIDEFYFADLKTIVEFENSVIIVEPLIKVTTTILINMVIFSFLAST